MGNKFCRKKKLNINSVDKKKIFEKANELLNARKYEDAIRYYDRAIELNEHNWSAFNNKGLCLLYLE